MKVAHVFSLLILVVLGTFRSGAVVVGKHSWSASSVLSDGNWVKLRVATTGIYKLTYEEIRAAGINDPARVHLHGYGGAMLPEDFSQPFFDDLPEVSVYVEKGTDGRFGPGDFLLFYGQGPVAFRATRSSADFEREQNPYSTHGYYFLTESDAPMKEMERAEVLTGDGTEITWFNDYVLHERELASVAQTGRDLFGESFGYTTVQSFPLSMTGIEGTASLKFNFVSKALSRTSLKVEIDGQSKTFYMEASSANDYYEKAKNVSGTLQWSTSGADSPTVKLTYGQSGQQNARLDYLLMNCERRLGLYGSFTLFRISNPQYADRWMNYTIANATATMVVWDLTDRLAGKIVPAQYTTGKLRFTGRNRYEQALQTEYAVINPQASFAKPEVVGRIENQNLHALPQTDMVIISPSEFVDQAETIARLHREMDGLRVVVVSPQAIYNEYSSGAPDATAYRRFLKMFYDRAKSDDERPRYLLLFGDGAYDNRLLGSEWNDTQRKNFLLTYQSTNSLLETSSYVSDDYFGLLDDDEGGIPENGSLDVGIGRFPVTTKQEAVDVTNKVLLYSGNTDRGSWKNQLAFVADDGDANLHVGQADEIARYLNQDHKEFVVNKIYCDAFQKQATASGARYPDVNKTLMEKIQSGVLLVDYVGHGTTSYWATEQIMTTAMISSLRNVRMPIWVTATCDFSRFDYHSTSAGETALLNGKGGAIALFTTTRTVYSGPNHQINTQFIRNIFNKENGMRYRLGDVMKLTKRALGSDFNKMSFTLLGDPAITLNYPEYRIGVTTINGRTVDGEPDQLKAFQKIEIDGNVYSPQGTPASDFTGTVRLTVYDCEEDYVTLDNDKTGKPFRYKDRRKVLFSGSDSVRNGQYTLAFTVPKDISYSNLQGRMNLYASDAMGNEAQGWFDNYIVGGTDSDADTTAVPQIVSLYLNTPAFNEGDVVNETPVLFAHLEDKAGINVSGNGFGHDLVAIVDGSIQATYTLNDYYEPETGQPGKGGVAFKLPELSEGRHSLFFRAWNVVGNSVSKTIEFTVQKGAQPRLTDIYVDRNPATSHVNFYLKHDRPGTLLDVKLEVFSLSGILVWTHRESTLSTSSVLGPIGWNLTQGNGQITQPGLYLYRATLSSPEGKEATRTRKLIITAR